RDDEYLLGPDLLVAPVLTPGAKTRALYLPGGPWVDLWRSLHLSPGGAPVLGAARRLTGGRTVTLPAPLEELPLLARTGTILALLPSAVDTLASYGRAPRLVHLAARGHRMAPPASS